MKALIRSLITAPMRNVDLIALFAIVACAIPLVPTDHAIARPDLAPWITAMVVMVGLLRGQTLGDPTPPSLTPRRWEPGRWMLIAARIGSPLALFLAYDAAATLNLLEAWTAAGVGALTAVLRGVGARHGSTAWTPRAGSAVGPWLVRVVGAGGIAILAGLLHHLLGGTMAVWAPVSVFVGLQLHAVGLLEDRLSTRRQRKAAGRRDGRPYRPALFRYALTALGPSSGLLLLLWLHELLIGPVDFAQAPIVSLHVFAWAAVLFPHATPIAMSCLLHEVVPSGGSDPGARAGSTQAFDAPPVGALRINPVWIRRLRALHHWVVPIRDARIEDLDDPIRPLFPRRAPPLAHHVLGDAAFEPDPITGQPQWAEITIRLKQQLDVGQLHEFSAQQRRMVILRPSSGWLDSLRRTDRTYRWDTALPRHAQTVVDASTTELRLRDGDILILSTEGVARAFELEIGAQVLDRAEFGHQRPPQLEDYVGAG